MHSGRNESASKTLVEIVATAAMPVHHVICHQLAYYTVRVADN